uniref:Ribosome association toxin PasT (RatA) of the RatAB toxin-antitoxin module n=1 Tax=Candidatus Kentrum sp. TUN TaxID=2126343 RepID=A0A450ZYD7_9GAMM|nr:MAG: Ribosome association toxin PasT (RatA) of the RatAB toxin-antitoxin module [Candidatus Kentron sp. TUN]VFK58800.1 MAG: Ribosome association toxin PasT (RatA) of the RatAB toxin-antitoxin module [Candidatus Kentron sp. TUN]VFK60672.1 MAG: Ribosome association toxin PasT (RatA) of the RatAB toxin-antitoxin module [Candidatus Kentron sp. TUN]
MTIIHRNALVPYSASDMYALVADVPSYPEFLPWCSKSSAELLTGNEVQASIEISHGKVRKSFSTLNRMSKDESIEMHLLNGPFAFLEGRWRFSSLNEEGCKVSLDMDFEFSNLVMKMLIGGKFTDIANTLVDAFCVRAITVYKDR